MHSAYHTLQAVTKDLAKRLPGKQIVEAFTQDRDELVIAFSGLAEHLVVSCRTDMLCCYLHGAIARAKKNSADVIQSAIGRVIEDVAIHPTDRVVTFRLSDGHFLFVQLFGARSNVMMTSAAGSIVDAFKRSRELVGHPLPPVPMGVVSSPESLAAAVSSMTESLLGAAIKKCAPHFPTILIREIAHRAHLLTETAVAMIRAGGGVQLADAFASVARDLANPHARIYSGADGTPSHFSIIPLGVLGGCREDRFDDIHTAVRSFIAWKRSAGTIADEHRSLEQRIRRTYDHACRIVAAMEADIAAGDRAELYRRYGSLILQHMAEIPPRSASVTLLSGEEPVTIPLIPAQSPSENAQRYFEKSKTSKRARELAERRRLVYVGRMERNAALLTELERIVTRQELKLFMEQHQADLHNRKDRSPSDDQDRPLFRVFDVEGGFEVWAGKSSANNDVLTLRHAKPQDFWFHARGVPGSHVILRVASGKGEPGKRAIRQAASIAAYYSKMRTASMVPVTVTLRKYVHKPKGAKAGSVVLQREDVIMVEPHLPHPIEDNDE